MKNRLIQVFILIIFTVLLLFVAYLDKPNNFDIDKSSGVQCFMSVPINTSYFYISTEDGESYVSGIDDIEAIAYMFTGDFIAYDYSGNFDYKLILGCVSPLKVVEENILINGNKALIGNKIFIFDTNLEKYFRKMQKQYGMSKGQAEE